MSTAVLIIWRSSLSPEPMSSAISRLLSWGASNAVETFERIGGIADRFIETPDENRAFRKEMAELVAAREEATASAVIGEMEQRGGVLQAELNQGDKYTKRARPSIIYTGLVLVLYEGVLIPLVEAGFTVSIPIDVPPQFWLAWGGIAGTWVIGRSIERHTTTKMLGQLAIREGK